jgi:hypothetical protein
MNEREVRELFFQRLQHLSPEAEYELCHPDYVMEMPRPTGASQPLRRRDSDSG